MNVSLSNFYNITVSDTSDTIFVYNNTNENPKDLRVKIDFFDDDDLGLCEGVITDTLFAPIENAKVYFFYYGVYLVDSAFTDASGNYSSPLPEGKYTIAAEKEGYRVTYYYMTHDPYFAQEIEIDSGQVVNLNLQLPALSASGLSVSGLVYDSTGNTLLDKGVVVVRKGTHVPSLAKYELGDTTVYTGFVKQDGSFSVDVENDGFYFVQAYSNYFLPGYYNDEGNASVFWQDADSLLINSSIVNKDLYLSRDSSFGGGTAIGNISFNNKRETDFRGITIFAEDMNGNNYTSYNFGKETGTFNVYNLPYGTYRLVAQQVGSPNGYSNYFTIDVLNPVIGNIIINFDLTDIKDEEILAEEFVLHQNYPNPFNPSTKISWHSAASSHQSIKVYDILGNEIATLVDEYRPAGTYEVEFSQASGIGKRASGIYFYQLKIGSFIQTKKMLLLK